MESTMILPNGYSVRDGDWNDGWRIVRNGEVIDGRPTESAAVRRAWYIHRRAIATNGRSMARTHLHFD